MYSHRRLHKEAPKIPNSRSRRTVSDSFSSTERDAHILAVLTKDGRVEIAALAEQLSVSEMTIRRDLDRLDEGGYLRRVRGGAVAVEQEPFGRRRIQNPTAKEKIADKLIDIVGDGGAIAFDTSSTLQYLAERLTNVENLTVLTNGPETFFSLQKQPGVTALLTGGQFEERTGGLIGPIAVRAAHDLVLRNTFISCAAVDPAIGTMERTLEAWEVKLALVDAATNVTLAVDHSKLGQYAAVRGLPFERIDQMVTDLPPSDLRLDPYRELTTII